MAALDGAVVAVVGTHTYLGARIADRIAGRGRSVVAVDRPARGVPSPASGAGPVDRVAVAGDGPGPLVAAVESAAGGRRVAAVLHAEVDEASCREARLAELTPEAWRERCGRPIDSALWTARAGFDLMASGDGRSGQGGVLGFVCPSVALTGAAGHVASSATSEAVRLLVKSAARRWGRFGIACNAFAPGIDACVPPSADEGNPADGRPTGATALDPAGLDPADDIASLLLYLAGPGAARLTGATFGTDGGELMAP